MLVEVAMSKYHQIFQAISNLKNIRAELDRDGEYSMTKHCIDMAILELEDLKLKQTAIANKIVMLDYMEIRF